MKDNAFPPGYSFLASIVRTYKQIKDPIGTMQESMERFHGTYGVHLGRKKFIVTQDPSFIEYVLKTNHKNYHKSEFQTKQLGRFLGNGLLTSNGEFWLRQRRLIQPGFHMEKIAALYRIIEDTSEKFIKDIPLSKPVDVYPLMNRLAFEIVINTLFNVHVPDGTRSELSNFIFEAQKFVIKDIRQPHKSWWFRLSGELDRNLRRSARARQIISDIIKQRKESGEKRNDLLDMLLDARYEDNGLPMEEDQMIDEILVLIIAGHETTANALSWTLYLLAHHDAVQRRLREETARLSLREIVQHDYLAANIKESMRLYPPAWISDRVALSDDHYKQFRYPAGTIVVLFYYGLHRDPQFWERPVEFYPERFLKNADKDKGKIFFPFGAGPRLCIGNNFAMAEMAIFLQAFLKKFSVHPTSDKPSLYPLVTLKPDKIVLRIERNTA